MLSQVTKTPRTSVQAKLVRDGVVVALMKLINAESVPAHRLVSGCLANLTTTKDVTWELIQAKGHQVSFDEREPTSTIFGRNTRGGQMFSKLLVLIAQYRVWPPVLG